MISRGIASIAIATASLATKFEDVTGIRGKRYRYFENLSISRVANSTFGAHFYKSKH